MNLLPLGHWRTPTVVLLCGGLVPCLSIGLRHGFGLFLPPMTMEHGWGRETFAFALASQNLVRWGRRGDPQPADRRPGDPARPETSNGLNSVADKRRYTPMAQRVDIVFRERQIRVKLPPGHHHSFRRILQLGLSWNYLRLSAFICG
jgi:hypothetical protein